MLRRTSERLGYPFRSSSTKVHLRFIDAAPHLHGSRFVAEVETLIYQGLVRKGSTGGMRVYTDRRAGTKTEILVDTYIAEINPENC